MSNKNAKESASGKLATRHAKWQVESDKIRKVQISLDFPDTADVLLRTLAAREHTAPSSMVRQILGMPSSPPKRARIGVSFNDDELAELGRRYNIDPNNRAEIRRRVTEEVTQMLSQAKCLPTDPPEQGAREVSSGVMRDLQSASDSIHERFKQAIEARENNK